MKRVESAHASYFGTAFEQQRLVEQAKAQLERFADQYDVLVGTGISGAMVVPLLAFVLGKRFVIVRKPDDRSNHSGRRFEGLLAEGDRCLFVDDFISSGNTIMRTLETLRDNAARYQLRYVGRYEYQYNGSLTWEDSERWGITLTPEPRPAPNTVKPGETFCEKMEALDRASGLMERQMVRVPPRYAYKPSMYADFESFKASEAATLADMMRDTNRLMRSMMYTETNKSLVVKEPQS